MKKLIIILLAATLALPAFVSAKSFGEKYGSFFRNSIFCPNLFSSIFPNMVMKSLFFKIAK